MAPYHSRKIFSKHVGFRMYLQISVGRAKITLIRLFLSAFFIYKLAWLWKSFTSGKWWYIYKIKMLLDMFQNKIGLQKAPVQSFHKANHCCENKIWFETLNQNRLSVCVNYCSKIKFAKVLFLSVVICTIKCKVSWMIKCRFYMICLNSFHGYCIMY